MLTVKLEEIHVPDPLPLVVLDVRVHLFNILRDMEHASNLFLHDPKKLKSWAKCKWVLLLNNPLPYVKSPARGWQVLLCDDYRSLEHCNNYWRNTFAKENGCEAYKGNRSTDRDESYNLILEQLLLYINQEGCGIPLFRQEGFEADDLAGALYRVKPKHRELYLWTSDSDWMQLVSDERRILFANALHYPPKLRSESEVLKHQYDRMGWLLDKPTDIIQYKAKFGDAGDNVMPESPEGLVDLINPPVKPDETELEAFCKMKVCNTNKKHLQLAQKWLLQNGLGY